MIRAAAKNHAGVAVLVDPGQYAPVLEELRRTGGVVSPETRQRLALEAFRRTAQYDAAIAAWLSDAGPAAGPRCRRCAPLPPVLHLDAERVTPLRYGENPHQRAAFYRPVGPALGRGWSRALRQLHGPELSYNNLLDLAGALGLLVEFDRARGRRGEAHESLRRGGGAGHRDGLRAGAGLGSGLDLRRGRRRQPARRPGARRRAGGILLEILFAPAFEPDALEELRRTKKKLRVLRASGGPAAGRRRAARGPERARGAAGPGGGRGRPRPGGRPRGEPAPADAGRVAGRPLRLEGRQAREVQRDRADVGGPGRSGSAPGR